MVCLGNEQRSFHFFEIASKYCISDSFVDYDGYSISSKGFLSTVVYIMVIWIKFIHFSSLIPKMLMFNLAISCLTTFNLPWFMDLTFQVSVQYCCLQHQTLLSPPDISTTGHHFCCGPALFLELFLRFCPVPYWTHSDLGGSSSSVISFCFFILFMGFLRQQHWSGLSFLSPVDQI